MKIRNSQQQKSVWNERIAENKLCYKCLTRVYPRRFLNVLCAANANTLGENIYYIFFFFFFVCSESSFSKPSRVKMPWRADVWVSGAFRMWRARPVRMSHGYTSRDLIENYGSQTFMPEIYTEVGWLYVWVMCVLYVCVSVCLCTYRFVVGKRAFSPHILIQHSNDLTDFVFIAKCCSARSSTGANIHILHTGIEMNSTFTIFSKNILNWYEHKSVFFFFVVYV